MNKVHPTALLGPGVQLGQDNVIGPHAVLTGPLVVGDGNWIGPGVILGAPPEVRGFPHVAGWEDETSGAGIRIGDLNVFREYALVHQGWKRTTTIGSACFLMNRTYIAHDCDLSDAVSLAAGVSLGGHVRVGVGATVGLGAQVHQRRVVGPGSMVGMSSVVTRDVPPYVKVFGNPARIHGINGVGAQRAEIPEAAGAWLEQSYPDRPSSGGGQPFLPDLELVPAALQAAFQWWIDARS